MTDQGTADRARIERYEPTAIEPRWQARWAELELLSDRPATTSSSRRYYLLTMYDYPSGDLHIGHWYVKTPTDALARFQRMQGDNVFFPIGFDAFGLPAENAAIKRGIHPRDVDDGPTSTTMRRQLPHDGRRLRLVERGRLLRAPILPLEPVAVPAVPQGRAGLSNEVRGRLVPQRRDPGPRAGRGRRPALLALRRQGREARPGAVVPAHHEVRRRAARLHRHRLAGAHPHHADQLDRSLRGRDDRLHDRARRAPARRRRAAASSRPGRTRSSGRPSWSWPRSTRWSSG